MERLSSGLGDHRRYSAEAFFELRSRLTLQFGIRPLFFVVFAISALGAVVAATGEAVESDYVTNCIEIGSNSPYLQLIPYEVTTLEGLIDS